MRKRRGTGQSALELALLLPILLMMLLGCLDMGRAFMVWMAVTNASREAARYAALNAKIVDSQPDKVRLVAAREIAAEGLSTGPKSLGVALSYPKSLGGGPIKDEPVRVSVQYTLTMLTTYMFAGGPMIIRASTDMPVLELFDHQKK